MITFYGLSDATTPDGASYFMHVHIARAADRVGVALNDTL